MKCPEEVTHKTAGQRLYEIKYPRYVKVCAWEDRHFAESPVYVENPTTPVPWKLLTKREQGQWEAYAVGHHLVYSPPAGDNT